MRAITSIAADMHSEQAVYKADIEALHLDEVFIDGYLLAKLHAGVVQTPLCQTVPPFERRLSYLSCKPAILLPCSGCTPKLY